MSDNIRQPRYPLSVICALTLVVTSADAAVPADELTVDPTLPLFFESSASEAGNAADRNAGYTLNSILTRGGMRIAVINSQRVRVGETVGAATVTAIAEDSVTLDIAGRIQVLQLYKSTIRTPTGDGG